MEVLIIAVLIGLIPAFIAKGKGRSFGLWWFFGAALFIVALPASLIIKANASTVGRVNISAGMNKYPTPEERIARARARRLSREPLSSNSPSGQGAISPLQNESSTPGDKISNNLNLLPFTGFLGALLVLLSWVGVVSYQVGWIGFAVGAASAVFLNRQ